MSYQRARKISIRPGRAVKRVSRRRATRMGLLGMGDATTGIDTTSYDYSAHPECDPSSDQYYQKVDPTGATWGMQGTLCNTLYPPSSTAGGSDTQTGCAQGADQALASLGGLTSDLQKTWNPTGYYDSKTLRSLVATHQQMMTQGYSAISQALGNRPTQDNADLLNSNKDALDQVAAQAQNYIAAANDADAKNITAIEAQGLKAWVLDSIDATYNAAHAAYVVSCMQPWWFGTYQTLSSVASAFYGAAKAIVGLGLKVGQATLKAIEGTFDLISFATTYGPYIAAGVLAWWLIGGPKAKPRTA